MEALSHMGIPIWREARLPLEHAALLRDPVMRGEGVPRGDGAPVMLIPGFLAGDPSLSVLGRWLERIGYAPCRAGIRANVDCTARALERLEAQLERLAEGHGRPARIVGQSRGGSMARVLAVRRPDAVESIVTLGAPLSDQLAVHPLVRAQVRALALIGSLRVPGLFSYDCAEGPCCARAREDAAAPFPAGVRFTSVYSRSDGVVDWRSCLDPAARQVEVDSTHCGMAVNAGVFRAVAEALRVPRRRLL
jgi:pimeloyl-ACP methyl ester carboxylesterase